MADFTKFGQEMAGITAQCAGNMDRRDTALFLVAQQELIQADAIKARREGKAAGNNGGAKQSATSMLEQMRAMMKG